MIDADESRIRVKFKGWVDKYNEWLPRNSDRIAPYGAHIGWKGEKIVQTSVYWEKSERKREIQQTDARHSRYILGKTMQHAASCIS